MERNSLSQISKGLDSVSVVNIDFGMSFQGSIATLFTYSERARKWVKLHLSFEPWQCDRVGDKITSIYIDSRFACDVMQLAINDGMVFESAKGTGKE